MTGQPCLMVVAGEASGDALGADLIRALRSLPGGADIRIVGIGGPAMLAQGVSSPFDIAELSILGLFEGLAAYPRVRRKVAQAAAFAERERPDVVVLIDSWGFTLRVAKAIRKLLPDCKLIKYVAPQVWASRPARAGTLAKTVDHLISIQPLDLPHFEAVGLPTTLVGNPVLRRGFLLAGQELYRKAAGLPDDQQIVLILPGSRPAEIRSLMPIFKETTEQLSRLRPDLKFALPLAGTVEGLVRETLKTWSVSVDVVSDPGLKESLMRAGTVALACSGTVTTELALARCPMVVAYRMGAATYLILKRIFKPRWITMLSITAGREIVPEYLQGEARPEILCQALQDLLENEDQRNKQLADQMEALKIMGLGLPDPSEGAARVVAGFLPGMSKS